MGSTGLDAVLTWQLSIHKTVNGIRMLHLSQACVMPTLTAMRPVLREEGVKGKVSAEAGVHTASLAKAGSAA